MLFYILFLTFPLFSQVTDTGSLVIICDPRIDLLVKTHKSINNQYPLIPGWRVQIFFESGTQSKILAKEVMNEFNEKFSDTKSYLIFVSPYYKVVAGDFRTRMDAEKFLDEIQKDYPSAFVTRDEINFPDLEKN